MHVGIAIPSKREVYKTMSILASVLVQTTKTDKAIEELAKLFN